MGKLSGKPVTPLYLKSSMTKPWSSFAGGDEKLNYNLAEMCSIQQNSISSPSAIRTLATITSFPSILSRIIQSCLTKVAK